MINDPAYDWDKREGRVVGRIEGPEEETVPESVSELVEVLNKQLDTTDILKPLERPAYHHETKPAYGEHGAWQEWYINHSQCGGTWVYIKDPRNPRVQCSCSMGMA
jgi:hypothetical protein